MKGEKSHAFSSRFCLHFLFTAKTSSYSSTNVSVYSSLIVSPSFGLVWEGKMQPERPGKRKRLVEENIIAYSLVEYLMGKVCIWWNSWVFNQQSNYKPSQRLSFSKNNSPHFKPKSREKRDVSSCIFTPVISSSAQQ